MCIFLLHKMIAEQTPTIAFMLGLVVFLTLVCLMLLPLFSPLSGSLLHLHCWQTLFTLHLLHFRLTALTLRLHCWITVLTLHLLHFQLTALTLILLHAWVTVLTLRLHSWLTALSLHLLFMIDPHLVVSVLLTVLISCVPHTFSSLVFSTFYTIFYVSLPLFPSKLSEE